MYRKNPVFRLRSLKLAMLFVVAFSVSVSADVLVSVGSPGNTNINLGTAGAGKSIDFYIGQGAAPNDSVDSLVAQYTLQAGLVPGPNGVSSNMNSAGTVSATGMTGTANYFGAGNLVTSTITKNSNLSFTINQLFGDGTPQPLLPAGERWFTLNLDTTGLAANTYTINLASPAGSFRNGSGASIAANNNLSFTVSAIPEPSSFAVLAMIGGVGCLLRRVRRPSMTR